MRRTAIVPPILIALYSPLSLLAHNITEIHASDAYRAALISIAIAFLSTAIFSFLFRDIVKGALISIGVIIVVFSYGHIYQTLKTVDLLGFAVGRHRILFPALLTVFIIYALWIKRRKSPTTTLLQFILATSIIASIIPTYTILRHGLEIARYSPPIAEQVSVPQSIDQDRPLPDVYYIVLDGYARQDVLMQLFNYDNASFLSALEERGFYIADQSHANYALTLISIPSSMNMTYLDEFATSEAVRLGYEETALMELLQNSVVRRFLKSYGYEMVAFETGYLGTEVTNADYYLTPNQVAGVLNRFEVMLLDTTLYRFLRDTFTDQAFLTEHILYPEYEIHRARIEFTLSSLVDFTEREGNYFIFAHVVSPHPPFVFDESGNAVPANTPFSLEDGDHYHGDIDDYRALYPKQLAYINKLVLDTIDAILDNSDAPPIVIIQADHGSGVSVTWEDIQPVALQERFSIMNAYFFSDGDYSQLYPTISPVNSFRLVFNQFFEADFELLEDRSYFSEPTTFLTFIDVTDRLKETPTGP